ncbi:MAG: YbaB/EbfC family nucleoid-associated protein [Candidatus Cardinium sp.]|uniref:Nucleoid-associated protein DK880_00554 n=1 Tax=Candidatus Cardinium hertigii TaxID=247481 RepID=A0A2Z3LCG9_9BACT|nr:YbaB/EbfC family nucleoid-associated protein [Candidatus Cardinium hertigii]AWN81872.1 Nucleoid-associated protein YbaB [Candidatus Cardinium hertigii]MDD9139352.1 YbaB/EbfC family nucleoid-associated protein [Candidatus Cardinium sp.]
MDITKLFGQMDQFRKKMETLQQQMGQLVLTKEAGAGLVKVTVNGNKQLTAVTIDESLFQTKDKKIIEELIIGATNLALTEIEEKIQTAIQNSTMEA